MNDTTQGQDEIWETTLLMSEETKGDVAMSDTTQGWAASYVTTHPTGWDTLGDTTKLTNQGWDT